MVLFSKIFSMTVFQFSVLVTKELKYFIFLYIKNTVIHIFCNIEEKDRDKINIQERLYFIQL